MSKPTVVLDNMIYQKIMYWVHEAKGEVSGLGKVKIENGNIRVISAILLMQENTSTTTDLDADAVNKAIYELRDEPGHLNFWWHSHADMGVFWSGTDDDTIAQLGGHGSVLAIVFNKKNAYKACYHQGGNDFFPAIKLDDLTMKLDHNIEEDVKKEWKKQFDEKCKPKVYKYNNVSQGPWWNDDEADMMDEIYEGKFGFWYMGQYFAYSDPEVDELVLTDEDTMKAFAKKRLVKKGVKFAEKGNTKELIETKKHKKKVGRPSKADTVTDACILIPAEERDVWYAEHVKVYGYAPLNGLMLDRFFRETTYELSAEDEEQVYQTALANIKGDT